MQLIELRRQVPGAGVNASAVCSVFCLLQGFMDRVRFQPWDMVLLGMEWNTGADEAWTSRRRVGQFDRFLEVVLFNVPPGGRPKQLCCALRLCVCELEMDPEVHSREQSLEKI